MVTWQVQTDPDGTVITVRADGTKHCRKASGWRRDDFPDGSYTQTDTDGNRISMSAEGIKEQSKVDGTRLRALTDFRLRSAILLVSKKTHYFVVPLATYKLQKLPLALGSPRLLSSHLFLSSPLSHSLSSPRHPQQWSTRMDRKQPRSQMACRLSRRWTAREPKRQWTARLSCPSPTGRACKRCRTERA